MEIDKERYKRNILLPEVGEEGQKKLAESRVLVVGAGGLGSPVSLYLAAAGVGTIGIADFDRVDVSNLQRQILYREQDIGKAKAELVLVFHHDSFNDSLSANSGIFHRISPLFLPERNTFPFL